MMMYGYDSGEASETAYTRRGIYREAQTLLHGLLQLRTPDTEVWATEASAHRCNTLINMCRPRNDQ